jgi:predicted GIY-YIG superfamily endonuclease
MFDVKCKYDQNLEKCALTYDTSLIPSWRCIRIKNITGTTIKSPPSPTNPSGVIYSFTCSCKEMYIGESARNLHTRVLEHQRNSLNSSVNDHINICNAFNLEYKQKYGRNPERKDRHEFVKSKFKCLRRNIFNYFDRTLEEGIFIALYQPSLNEQNQHRKVSLII